MEWTEVRSLLESLLDEAEISDLTNKLTFADKEKLTLALLTFLETLSEPARAEISREIKRFAWLPLQGDLYVWRRATNEHTV